MIEVSDDIIKMIKTIAEVPLKGEPGYLRLDGHDATGFIKLCRYAMELIHEDMKT